MALAHISLNEIDDLRLANLISIGASESIYIDYKRDTYGNGESAHAEFLADIASFANTGGGDLVIGMQESGGVPTQFVPFSGNVDDERLRLEEMARGGLEPRIPNLQTHSVPLSIGGNVIVVRMPRSFVGPHRVVYRGRSRFWARTSSGKYEPSVDELRRLFNSVPQLAEQIRAFRLDRLTRIASGETPVSLAPGECLLVLHVVPYSAFDLRQSLSTAILVERWRQFPPLGRSSPTHPMLNFDGLACLSNSDPWEVGQHSYVQVFRSGAIEGVATVDRSGDGAVSASTVDKYCVASSKRYIDTLQDFSVEPPYVILASLINVRGRVVVSGISGLSPNYIVKAIGRDPLHFSEVVIEDIASSYQEQALKLRFPLLEQLWNAAGYSSPQTFDRNGKWIFSE